MTQLLPSLQAERVRRSLVDYLSTTFALADAEPRRALAEFLEHPDDGIFKGPYVRLRLPFRAADESWREYLDWTPPFPPYRHQAEAYARLTSKDLGPDKPRPLPTIVTTGTGSGKTEAFLHPILDHCRRARLRGETGMKALILYPMNALADDQARRLTDLLTGDPALAGVTAGLYTGDAREGQAGAGRTKVSPEGLITHRGVLRDAPPDILLTNYKMLDQLLLRPEDQPLWAQSWESLTYLVLDEFHTYDGAQGTDVAILLRRLGLALRSHVPADHPDRERFDERPLGRLTPVATSATLGDSGDPTAMLDFASQVFGETLTRDAAVTERRVDLDTFTAAARERVDPTHERTFATLLAVDLAGLAAVGRDHAADADRLLGEVVRLLYKGDAKGDLPAGVDDATLLQAHSGVRRLVDLAEHATHVDDLVRALFTPATVDDLATAREALAAILAGLSIIRLGNRNAVSVDVTLWLRELTRVDRLLAAEPGFRWTDDGGDVSTDTTPALPAVFCRACGRSGWGVTLTATGRDLADRDPHIRADHMNGTARFRALLHAPGEAAAVTAAAAAGEPHPEQAAPALRWLDTRQRTILARTPAQDDEDLLEGRILPVVMLDGEVQDVEKRSRADECPSCGRTDQIRFLGSAIATMLSVTLSSLFGDPDLDAAEKRSLVFTDSVQDAAHRAGFVDHRSHAMSLRTALRRPLTAPMTLPEWVDAAMRAAEDDPFARYRLVPAALVGHSDFEPYWTRQPYTRVPVKARNAVRRRLAFDAALEVGLQTGFGRTLEATGSIGVHVSAGRADALLAHGRAAFGGASETTFDGVRDAPDQAVRTWVRGALEHVRRDGGIDHEWLTKYVKDDGNRHWIWGGRRREQGAPAFPRGRSAPAFPVAGADVDTSRTTFVALAKPRSWYARWAATCLGVTPAHGAALSKQLFARLADTGILSATPTDRGGVAYGIPPERVMVRPLSGADLLEETTLLVCDTCRSPLPVSPIVGRELQDGPCMMLGCRGRMRDTPRDVESFYRTLFASTDMRRVDAREHTSLLDAAERRAIEAGFKRSEQQPGDPNVLVATPTLEMGIDIGDLSTVMLSSLPDSVAKYQQRVGRGGRLTGSSLSLAYVTGRGENLPRLGDPTSMIDGAVRPPATYLDAEEILRRQFLASVVDRLVREGRIHVPRTAGEALGSCDPGTLLGDLIARLRDEGPRLLEAFVATFADPGAPGLATLAEWVLGTGQPDHDGIAPSAEATICRAVGDHCREVEELQRRRAEVEAAIPALREQADLPAATEEDQRALRSAIAGSRLLRKVLRGLTDEPWISGLELRGLLPNYSLLDDTVRLDAQVSWTDPDTGQYDVEPLIVDRGSSRALTELAPGAYFYARRLEMRVDGVELGQDLADVTTHVACDTCGYVARLTSAAEASPRTCPRCGSAGIAETGQRFEAARLERVFSDIRRDDATIGDDSDERRRTRYEVVVAPDFDPARRVGAWTAEGVGLGVAHYRRMTVRWFNVGREVPSPETMIFAGRGVTAQRFRLCESCGKLDGGSGRNEPHEHRAWCRYRNAEGEHTRSLSLSRELVTQGVAIGLPPAVTGDMHSVPSLAAALHLGLQEVLGGAPTHLRVEVVPHPVDPSSGEAREALFLHDTVPGGTGYLTELATPGRLWPILVRAAQVLADCPCAQEGRGSCHRCLAPYGRDVYRIDALRALTALLDVGPDRTVADLDPEVCEWTVNDGAVQDDSYESPLEQRFRALLAERLAAMGHVRTTPTAKGPALTITGAGDRAWSLQPQVDVAGSRPDFVLSAPGAPAVAIFTDGRAFHAGPAVNRLADDAAKRERLRLAGYRVISVTHADLATPDAPDWLNPAVLQVLMQQPAGTPGSGISTAAVTEVRNGPLALLEGTITDPESPPRRSLADALTLLLGVHPGTVADAVVPADADLVHVAAADIRGQGLPSAGGRTLLVHRRPHLVLAARMAGAATEEVALVLDDRDEALTDAEHAVAWREWLRLSNLLTFSSVPTTITTLQALARSGASPEVDVVTTPLTAAVDLATDLPGGWAEVDLDPAYTPAVVVDLARRLAEAGAPAAEAGAEVETGSVVELAWRSAKVAVVADDMDAAEIDALRAAGWAVHLTQDDTAALAQAVLAALNPTALDPTTEG